MCCVTATCGHPKAVPTAVWILINTEVSLCSLVLLISYQRQSTAVWFSFNQLNCATVSTQDAHVKTDTVTPYSGIVKESIWILIMLHYLWTECPQWLVKICDKL
ncbi:hypothetical protein NDA11_007220 [Ustilago hordei]|uniref:Uncharacterized protein n=1 Tax=Ustilago hordei TaxID=120017 RepID=I2FQK2_USTHO|nr:uncharacterized protein UHO2_05235 [Ustilago hordei]KAJ1042879.1 hypothetical protein NDA10_001752 [Ustilago hordei]KAJ1571245.1 hypothetical protein NDA12_003574 [Ustilago hordei]KAJ1571428.1 hypothetical protein NDA15_001948 [Ustilago hordei]KAJ1596162.1 hypothetical protein NDA11_007220 [Ustilago hordei]KAJ1596704.1 hypothetical protein NDA14_004746 [Ustilago hordei]